MSDGRLVVVSSEPSPEVAAGSRAMTQKEIDAMHVRMGGVQSVTQEGISQIEIEKNKIFFKEIKDIFGWK